MALCLTCFAPWVNLFFWETVRIVCVHLLQQTFCCWNGDFLSFLVVGIRQYNVTPSTVPSHSHFL